MLFTQGGGFLWSYHNGGANPSSACGLSVVPGTGGAEGSWSTALAAGANLTEDVCGILLSVGGGNTTTAQKDHLLDLGVDPAGSTAYAAVISNIVCGQSDTPNRGFKSYYFPLRIKAGSQVACRVQGNNATPGTVRVWATFYGKPSRHELMPVGHVSETIGTITGTGGQAFTPGNAADGAWALLGAPTRPLWWWQLGCQCSAGTIGAQYTYVDLAVGDATNKDIIIKNHLMSFSGTAEIDSQHYGNQLIQGYRHVPAGANLYVRGRCSGAPTAGYNAVAIGVG